MVLNLGNCLAELFSKVVLGVLPGLPPVIFSDVHFLERVLLTFSEMVVPQLVLGKIGT